MPRKTHMETKHVKTVKRGAVSYLYFNTGQKVDGRPVYVALGKAGDIQTGARYSAALAARTRRTGEPTALSLPQLARRFWSSPDFRKKSDGTQKTYLVYLRRLEREFNNAPACALESSDIYELMDDMGGNPAAIDMMLLAGGQMYAWGLKRKYVAHNPFASIDREDWEGRTYEPWPEEVLEEALADELLWLPVHLLYFTGQRIGDCCSIAWTDVRAKIYVKQQKTGKELNVPIHSRLADALARAPRTGATVLADAKGHKAKDQTIRARIKAFGAERGLNLVPHGLRKNAVNALLEAGCSVGEVSSITGQSLRIVELYARQRNNERMSDAAMAKWERLPNRETTGKLAQEMAEK